MKQDVVQRLALEAAEICGVELYHVEWAGGRTGTLRVFIDRPGGVTVGDCEKVSRELSTFLDVEDPIVGRYNLEVSSPGLDRRLFTAAHFKANAGKEIDLKTLRPDAEGRRKHRGVMSDPDEGGFFLLPESGDRLRFEYADMESARLTVKF